MDKPSTELILDDRDFGVKLDDLPWLFHTGNRRESCTIRVDCVFLGVAMARSAFEDSSSGESSSEEAVGGDRASSPESDESIDEADFSTGSILSFICSLEALNTNQQHGELTDFSSLVRRAPPSE